MRRTMLIGAVGLLTWLGALPVGAATDRTVEDVVGQGPGGSIVGAAELTRSANGLHVDVTMTAPAPGSYSYPDGALNGGGPEVYSLWAFVFPNPGLCGTDGCAGLGDVKASGGGVFNVAGHPVNGETLVLSGHITRNTEPFALNHLTNVAGAEVHVAVAPHGTLDAAQMPAQATIPSGDSPAWWWIALLK